MKCDELLKMLNDYVDGDIDPQVCEDLQEHLKDCNPCRVVVDNIRQTISLYKGDQAIYELPVQFRQKLHGSLRDKWQKLKRPSGDTPSAD